MAWRTRVWRCLPSASPSPRSRAPSWPGPARSRARGRRAPPRLTPARRCGASPSARGSRATGCKPRVLTPEPRAAVALPARLTPVRRGGASRSARGGRATGRKPRALAPAPRAAAAPPAPPALRRPGRPGAVAAARLRGHQLVAAAREGEPMAAHGRTCGTRASCIRAAWSGLAAGRPAVSAPRTRTALSWAWSSPWPSRTTTFSSRRSWTC
mmetsp:Transcript_73817/g.238571  ORF Transcript_73817/g.238571 Transcript_73817/m.238571 type:complete len:212 (+) Transcript_73817:81-716(+)